VDERWQALRKDAEESISQEQFESAETSLREALKLAHEFAENDPKVIYTLERMGDVLVKLGKETEGEIFYRQCLVKRQMLKGENHLSLTDVLNKVAELAYDRCQYKQAEKDYLRALGIYKTALGLVHPAVGFTASKLARTFLAQERFDDADTYYAMALSITSEAFGKDNPGVVTILEDYLHLLSMVGKDEKIDELKEEFNHTYAK
jgi:tetratricopeptide (TPR) repeat protein